MYQYFIKRSLDILLSVLGLIILSPILIFISLSIKCTSPGPILFKQERVVENNQLFKILKFRSMRIETPKDCPTHLLDNPDQYITKVGKFMRKTSMDELPQLWNILRGDMSVIGPRPSLPNQYDLNALRDKNGSSSIRPGLTGLAQISGRDELEIEIKAELDGKYANQISFFMDCKCFVGTLTSVMKSDGVIEGGTGAIKKGDEV